MRAELRVERHKLDPKALVIEVWYEDRMICTVNGGDGPSVRIISKHPYAIRKPPLLDLINVVEVIFLTDHTNS